MEIVDVSLIKQLVKFLVNGCCWIDLINLHWNMIEWLACLVHDYRNDICLMLAFLVRTWICDDVLCHVMLLFALSCVCRCLDVRLWLWCMNSNLYVTCYGFCRAGLNALDQGFGNSLSLAWMWRRLDNFKESLIKWRLQRWGWRKI